MLIPSNLSPLARAQHFADWLGIRVPILLAPMASACPPSLSISVANAGGLGACGALLMKPDEILAWSREFRSKSDGHFQLNLWIPGPPPVHNVELEKLQREFLSGWGPAVHPEAGDTPLHDFDAQCKGMLEAEPKVISSIMGLYEPKFISELKRRGILWFATVTTVAEAKAAESAGADAVVAQGMEAGGHRGAFHPEEAEQQSVGLLALLPQVFDAINIPVIATGGVADARGVAASLLLGASAVQIGTGFLRAPEAMTPACYADRLARTEAHETLVTRAFSGRPGRAVANAYVRAAMTGPPPPPYPIQRGLTAGMRDAAKKTGDAERMQLWAGQSAKLAKAEPAGEIVRQIWDGSSRLLNEAARL
jgi:nitronate monooxygenase